MEIVQAVTSEQVGQVRVLFLEYAEWIGVDLGFQGFERELAELPGDYARPDGRLLLALAGATLDGAKLAGDEAAGCVALRRFSETDCEMKRFYVHPAFRGTGAGRALAEAVIAEARAAGYERMLLDTLPMMGAAQALYRSLGFVATEAYRYNPVEGAEFLALRLRPAEG